LVERFSVAILGNYQIWNGFLGAGFMAAILVSLVLEDLLELANF
jgi:hypothetical protein